MILIEVLLVLWLPGAIVFRSPIADRERRARLPADERVFWAVTLSSAWSVGAVLALAWVGEYSFERLLIVNSLVVAVLALISRGRLAYNGLAPRMSWASLVPVGIISLGLWLFLPPAEYVMGGKDPGVYMNEGIQIAQRGEIVITDPMVTAVPEADRELFFPPYQSTTYYGLRFMGFFIQRPDAGDVIGQFPHLFPASVAIGYGLRGLSGARETVVFWAILGLVAVYFVATQIVGRAAAAAAVVLLSINVIEIWFARYPNAEVVMQALLFGAMLAFAHALNGGQRFFGPVSGLLIGLLLFLRYDAVIAIGTFAAAATVATFNRQPIGAGFVLALSAVSAVGLLYLDGPMRAYSEGLFGYTRDRGGWWIVAAAVVASFGCRRLAQSERWAARVRQILPALIAIALCCAALYAYFLRSAGGRLSSFDASSFRTFGWYVTRVGLLGAVAGTVLLVRRAFWTAPAFFLTTAAYSLFFFYKARIVPEHFWMERRFLAVTLPAAMIGLCALPGLSARLRGGDLPTPRMARAIGSVASVSAWVLIGAIGFSFWRASTPVRRHVEYAGLIPKLEALAATFGDRDLVLVESRNASDVHVLALPLAYIYARNVLVLNTPRPSRPMFERFLTWADANYSDVYFLGGGGTDLLTRGVMAEPVASDRFQIPEYDSPKEAYPAGARHKEFDYGVYRLVPGGATTRSGPISLRIGVLDDLNVSRFHAKERRTDTGLVFRWSRDVSYVSFQAISPDARQVIVWMSNGGRPAAADPPRVEISIEDRVLGTVAPGDDVQPYSFSLTQPLAESLAAQADPVRVRLRVPPWNPHRVLGAPDTRDLGVIVTRVEVR